MRTATGLLFLVAVCTTNSMAQIDPRGRVFVERGCSECHAIVGLHVKAKADVGPDLTCAYAEVPQRYGMTLERFFQDPTGIMRSLFATQSRVTPAQSDSIIQILRSLYAERLAGTRDSAPPAESTVKP